MAALTGAVAGHLANLQFGFDLTASATIFWLVLALAATVPLPTFSVGEEKQKDTQEKFGWLAHVLPTLVTLALIGLVCLRPLLADCVYWNSQQGTRSPQARQAEAERAVSLWPLNPQVWAAWGNFNAYWEDTEPRRYVQAEAAYRRTLELAPNVATYHAALGLVLTGQGRLQDGLAELERAVALDATDGTAYRHLADLYQALGRERRQNDGVVNEQNRCGLALFGVVQGENDGSFQRHRTPFRPSRFKGIYAQSSASVGHAFVVLGLIGHVK